MTQSAISRRRNPREPKELLGLRYGGSLERLLQQAIEASQSTDWNELSHEYGVIYFVLATGGDDSWVKIGHARCPHTRLQGMTSQHPPGFSWTWELIDYFPAGCKRRRVFIESIIHGGLSRYWDKGEWFKLPQEVMDQIHPACRNIKAKYRDSLSCGRTT